MKYFLYFLIFLSKVHCSDAKTYITEMANIAGIQIDGKRPFDIQVNNPKFYERALEDQSLGFGESYMEGWWECVAIDECIYKLLIANIEDQFKPTFAFYWTYLKAKLFNRQTKSGSMDVIHMHYELGNDLYKNMLDTSMAYSCGYWKNAKTLDEAQLAKYDLIARKLSLKKGMTVLDIGCGWGGFAKYIAQNYGVKVVAITLSQNQAEFAKKNCEGLSVEVRVQDYRDVKEKFDRVVEIGMFEHVGPKNYRNFMEICHNCLNDNGMLMLHTIGSNATHVTTDPWINKYIFPGGHLPSIAQIGSSIENLFIMEDWHNFGPDYDKTLMAWWANFNNNWDKLKSSYSREFYRMWKYYLLSCAGAFRARSIELWQVVLSKSGVPGGYETVR
ncbi:MAG: cyclopropane fatty acyl phospholipid synthase [Chlamydiae bacterium]|nr:cyclopropane fatty acyl phospholipid synthase [Chlamydiota bacterium]